MGVTPTDLVILERRDVFVCECSLDQVSDCLNAPFPHPDVWVLAHLQQVICYRPPQDLHTAKVDHT